jgi:acetylornithine deacetylase/succinyl-diaminopimelate desuccinylase-like protein
VAAGVKENAVPDFCEITLDRRLLPGEDGHAELEDLRNRLESLKRDDPDFEFEIDHLMRPASGTEIDPDSRFAAQVLAAAEEVTGRAGEIFGAPFGSDVRNLVDDAGIEAVTFGPGNVSECHCADERVALDQVRSAALATAKVALDLLM